jgi:trehalose 6-phosphate synthase
MAEWSNGPSNRDRCAQTLQSDFLAGHRVIIASNRGPVTFSMNEEGEFEAERGGGGLVTALLGMCRYTEATWVASAQSEADRLWGEGDVPLENGSTIRVRFVTPDEQAYENYYSVISNPLLWFLQHSMWDVPRAPVIDRSTWEAWEEGYVAVNRQFADAVARECHATEGPALVMLQDYHLYLAPRFIRKLMRRYDRPVLSHFVHIPWPGPEYWSILPPTMRQAILEGLCGADLLGFQTREDGLNFIRTCESHLPQAQVNFRRGRVWYRNHATRIRDFPISIDIEALRERASSAEVAAQRADIEERVNGLRTILRVDRIEPSKNIVRGFQAFDEMLELHPEHQGEVRFLALLVPSRMAVDEYQDYLEELMAVAGRVNAKYGTSEWEPVRVLVGESYDRAVAALQLYDVLLVNSIADGMNLVAKEGPIVNQRDGVLVLSERAGAHQQLEPGAIVISPCDVFATAEAMHQALMMSGEERREQAQRLAWLVEQEDITDWLCQQLNALMDLRR